jgi:hypothetical protein
MRRVICFCEVFFQNPFNIGRDAGRVHKEINTTDILLEEVVCLEEIIFTSTQFKLHLALLEIYCTY